MAQHQSFIFDALRAPGSQSSNGLCRRDVLAGAGAAALSTLIPVRAFASPRPLDTDLCGKILNNAHFNTVLAMAKSLLNRGLQAGALYPQVWIRDTNTFVELALRGSDHGPVRNAIMNFLKLQGNRGDIVGGYVEGDAQSGPVYRTVPGLPGLFAHKNTVESDQESSLVSCVRKYVTVTCATTCPTRVANCFKRHAGC